MKRAASHSPVTILSTRLLVASITLLAALTLMGASASAQNVSVAGSTGADGSYPTLTAAFAAINANPAQTGNAITVSIVGDTAEGTGTALLTQPTGGSWATLAISPSGGAARTISGATTAANPLIDFNGADNVTINGLNTSGNSLTISNTQTASTAGTSTIRFINDATGNTIQNATINGAATGASTGTIIFSTTTGTTGNDNNTVTTCNIGPVAATFPTNAIFSSGTTTSLALRNSGVQVTNNNIFDFYNSGAVVAGGVNVAGSTDWTITGNSFYQTASRAQIAGGGYIVIGVADTSGVNFIISNNFIGGSAASAAGTAWTETGATTHTFIGIRMSVGSATVSSLQNNTIQNINNTTSTASTINAGISAVTGAMNIGTTTGNTIGSTTGTGSITWTAAAGNQFSGILSGTGTPNGINISNNKVGSLTIGGAGVTTLYGIRIQGAATAAYTISNNTIGSTSTANSITNNSNGSFVGISGTQTVFPATVSNNTIQNLQVTSAGTSASLRGIELTGSISGQTISGNTIANFSTTSTNTASSSGTAIVGITLTGSATSGNTITTNTIRDLSSTTSGATSVYNQGIVITGTPGTTMTRNFIYNLSTASTSASSSIVGIQVFNSSATENIQNNMIRLGTGLVATINPIIRGVYDNTATSSPTNIRFNSIFIGGTQGAATVNTACIERVVASTMDIRNNILWNNRASTGAPAANAGRHYAIWSTVATGTITTDFNNLFADANGGTVGFLTSDRITLTDWRGAGAGFDLNSFSANPSFVDPTNATTPDLHLTASNPESRGAQTVGGITDDFDGQTRPQPAATNPDMGADEGSFTLSPDLTPPVISYTLLANSSGTVSRPLPGFATIVDNSGTVSGGANNPRLYYKKSTDANAIVGNTSADNGWKFVIASNATSPYDFTIDYTIIFGGTVTIGDSIQYFVVAQDATGNVGINSGTFATTPTSVILVTANLPTGTINSYSIAGTFSGSYDVGTGQTYTSLTGATPTGFFAAINGGVVTGNITVNIVSDMTEDGTNALNQWAEEGVGGYTMKIQPSAGTLRTISGAVANGMIRLNGADRVTIDGRFGGTGQFLLFRNTNAANPTFTFLNDATSNTLESCLIESANATATSGTVLFSTSTGTLGNSGNTIHNCDIRDRSDAAGVPANAVYSSGSAGAPNGTDTVSGCNVFNWTNAGVLVTATGAGNGWTVNPSSFYQTAARTTAMTAISIQGGSGHSVLNNSIGGTAPLAGGSNLATSNTFRGIDLTVGTASATSVQGNTIKNIRSTLAGSFTASYGIFLEAGLANIGNVTGNTVGSSVVGERYEISGDSYAIRVISTSTVNLSNNTVNNMTTAPGVPTGEFYFGISVEGTGGAHTVVNNTVTNLTNGSTPDASFNTQTIGMIVSATGAQTIRGNTISNVGSTDLTAVATLNNRVWGLLASGTAVGTVVDRNNISNIYASSAGAGARVDVITCLQSQTVANGTYTNNMISTTGGGASSDRSIFGILDLSAAPAISNYYFNSVNITGTATAANSTYAFNRNSTATVTIRDNIFADARSGGTGFHVAMANTNAAATGWSATASDWNLLFNSVAGNITQWLGAAVGNNLTLVGFQGATGGDTNTLPGDPLFTSTTDLHIPANSPAVAAGIPFGGVTTDFDNDPRPASNPDKGADEIVQAVGGVIPAGTYYNAAAANGDSLGGNVTITNQLTLGGILSTGANTLTIGCNGFVSGQGPTNYIIGNLDRTFCATGGKAFDVGTANGYSPVQVNATAGTFPADFTVKAVEGPQPNVNPSTSIQRYWTLTNAGLTMANLTFQYLAGDVAGTEANYKLIRVSGGTPVTFPASVVTPATHVATLAGVTGFSDWTVGENNAPTAAAGLISGVITRADGQPLGGVTVNLSGNQSARTITNGRGEYHFSNVASDGFYTVTPGLANYSFGPSSRSFALLGNRTDAGFTGTPNSTQTENPLNVGDFFVRQQYLDFLGREPDGPGWLYWTEQLNQCGLDTNCVRQKRIDISAAFFMSDEFQQGGNYVYRLYRAALGRRLTYAEFSEDRQQVIGGPGLDASRIAFADTFVARPEFMQKYQNIASAEVFVDALLQTVQQDAGLELSSQREALIQTYNSGADLNHSRSAVLRAVAESTAFKGAVYNASFVATEYFGYLQRGPDADGYAFWVEVLNHRDPGNYRGMVCSFLTSTEYQRRFSSVVVHSNNECGQ